MEDYDINELIALAKKPPSSIEEKLESIREPSEAYKFCLAKDIKQGKDKVSFRQLYYAYTQWAGDNLVHPVAFGRQLGKLFKRHRDSAGSFYLMDASALSESLNVNDEENKALPGAVPRTR